MTRPDEKGDLLQEAIERDGIDEAHACDTELLRRFAAYTIAGLLLLTAGCGDDADASPDQSTSTAPSTTTTTTTTSTFSPTTLPPVEADYEFAVAAAPDLTGLSGGRTLGPGRSGPSRRRLAEPTASARDVRGSGGTNG